MKSNSVNAYAEGSHIQYGGKMTMIIRSNNPYIARFCKITQRQGQNFKLGANIHESWCNTLLYFNYDRLVYNTNLGY